MSLLKHLDAALLGRERPDLIVLVIAEWQTALAAARVGGAIYRTTDGELRYRGIPVFGVPVTRSFAIWDLAPGDLRIEYIL